MAEVLGNPADHPTFCREERSSDFYLVHVRHTCGCKFSYRATTSSRWSNLLLFFCDLSVVAYPDVAGEECRSS
jgi:hypothetical protein